MRISLIFFMLIFATGTTMAMKNWYNWLGNVAPKKLEAVTCITCFDTFTNEKHIVTLDCKHTYCNKCFGSWYETQRRQRVTTTCPVCRTKILSLKYRARNHSNTCKKNKKSILTAQSNTHQHVLNTYEKSKKGLFVSLSNTHQYLLEKSRCYTTTATAAVVISLVASRVADMHQYLRTKSTSYAFLTEPASIVCEGLMISGMVCGVLHAGYQYDNYGICCENNLGPLPNMTWQVLDY